MFGKPQNLFSTKSIFFLNKTHKTKFKCYGSGRFVNQFVYESVHIFIHELKVRWVVGSILDDGPIDLFLVPASDPRLG